MHRINLEKYTTSVTFYFKDCSKEDDAYISLSITNSMLENAEPMSILVFLIFFNYLVKTLFIFIFILFTSSSLVFIMVWCALVWDCGSSSGSGCGLKCFSFKNVSK